MGGQHGQVARAAADIQKGVADLWVEVVEGQGIDGWAAQLQVCLVDADTLVVEAVMRLQASTSSCEAVCG